MKKSIMTIALCAIILPTIFFACKKESNPESKGNSKNINLSSYLRTSNNPFNYLGELHNEALTMVGEDTNFPDLSIQEKHDINIETNINVLGTDADVSLSDIGKSLSSRFLYLRL